MHHYGNSFITKNSQRNMLKSIMLEQERREEQKAMDKVPQSQPKVEEDKNDKIALTQQKKAEEQKRKVAAKEAVRFYYMNRLLTKLYESCCNYELLKDEYKEIRNNIVSNFIKEQTVSSIRKTMKNKSFILKTLCEEAETAEIETNKRNEVIHEEEPTDVKDSIKTFIPEDIDSDFCNKITNGDNGHEIADIGNHVRNYVSNSVEKFIIDNIEDKTKIKQIMSNVQDKVSTISTASDELDQEVKESVIRTAKQRIRKIEQRKKSFFESMVRYVARNAIINQTPQLLKEDNQIDMEKVVKVSEAMLTMMVLAEAIGFEFDEASMKAQFARK